MNTAMIDTVPLMAMLHAELVELLQGLGPEQWSAPTACAGWTVKDIAAHLLDGHLRRLSICRDGHSVPFPGGDLGGWLNELNASWVNAARRLSPRLLIDLHQSVGPQILDFWRSLDPQADAFYPVAWAGESRSAVWFDCARDFTEHWHHQQQIREATGAASLITRQYYPIVLTILMRCVPVAYADVNASTGTSVRIAAVGEAGGVWALTRSDVGWRIDSGGGGSPVSVIGLPQRDVWLLFTKKLTPEEANARATTTGDQRLAQPFFRSKAVMG